MALLRLLVAPVRWLIRFPLIQLIAVVVIVLLLQAADEHSLFGWIFDQLDRLVAATVLLCSNLFSVKSFTRSGLTIFLTVAYVYLALAIILFLLRIFLHGMIDLVGRSNAFGLRNAIARERGIAAYRAWQPFERIRPASIPQSQWEEAFAWPPSNRPPYPSLPYRVLRSAASYFLLFAIVAAVLQFFTSFPVITWLAEVTKMVCTRIGAG
jgi:hypothetical protein